MRTFRLVRLKDISGISGVGVVAEGVEFHDEQCVVSWLGKFHSIEVHPSIKQVMEIHGHSGATQIEFSEVKEGTLPVFEKSKE